MLGLDKQTNQDFEVIIDEDDNSINTSNFLNKALLVASSEYLVFLDGDCIPHKRLLESYANRLKPNTVCIDRRCYLNNKISKSLKTKQYLSKLSFFNISFNANNLDNAFCKTWLKPIVNTKRTIIGCNWGISKAVLIDINDFDETYEGWGCEDKDIDWRLRTKNKYTFINIKHQAIVYHLYHKPSANGEEQRLANIFLDKKVEKGYIISKNRIRKLH